MDFKNIKTIELKLINEKYFSDETQYTITSIIKDKEYRNFIKQLNNILNDNRLLYVSIFLFVVSFLFFGLFMNLSILLGWLLLVNFILLSVFMFYKHIKYNSYSRYLLMQEKINIINKKKFEEKMPINFCLLLRKKEEINFYSGVSVDISLIISYSDIEIYQPQPPIQMQPQMSTEYVGDCQQQQQQQQQQQYDQSNYFIPVDNNDLNNFNGKNQKNIYSTIQLTDNLVNSVYNQV